MNETTDVTNATTDAPVEDKLDEALTELGAVADNLLSTVSLIKDLRAAGTWVHLSKQVRNGIIKTVRSDMDTIRDLVPPVQGMLKREKRRNISDEDLDAALLSVVFENVEAGTAAAVGLRAISDADSDEAE